MYRALIAKFTQHAYLMRLLLETGKRKLVERSPYDSYWGDGPDGNGKNRLGELLMKLRAAFGEKIGSQPGPGHLLHVEGIETDGVPIPPGASNQSSMVEASSQDTPACIPASSQDPSDTTQRKALLVPGKAKRVVDSSTQTTALHSVEESCPSGEGEKQQSNSSCADSQPHDVLQANEDATQLTSKPQTVDSSTQSEMYTSNTSGNNVSAALEHDQSHCTQQQPLPSADSQNGGDAEEMEVDPTSQTPQEVDEKMDTGSDV